MKFSMLLSSLASLLLYEHLDIHLFDKNVLSLEIYLNLDIFIIHFIAYRKLNPTCCVNKDFKISYSISFPLLK